LWRSVKHGFPVIRILSTVKASAGVPGELQQNISQMLLKFQARQPIDYAKLPAARTWTSSSAW
jgi:hypothetical protein